MHIHMRIKKAKYYESLSIPSKLLRLNLILSIHTAFLGAVVDLGGGCHPDKVGLC